jgi:ribosomal protein L11 methylase PrmA
MTRSLPSSFRDPSGFLFSRDGTLYRQINQIYKNHYDHLMDSGLYEALTSADLLIPHEEITLDPADSTNVYKTIKPERIPFVSYPYEWSFTQLKDAALATLRIQKKALGFEMSLKDASAYNIQFRAGKPVLIDTLSFERYREGEPWVGYRQFCQHFLAPLALMAYKDVALNQLLRIYIDGVPLPLTSALLPHRTRWKPSLLTHIHLHAASQKRFARGPTKIRRHKMGRRAFQGLIESLESAVRHLRWRPGGTEWGEYYDALSYTSAAFEDKRQRVAEFLETAAPRTVWDLGGNTGIFARIASEKGIPTVCFDSDPAAVEVGYRECVERRDGNLLPLLLDLTNPSPGIGWEHSERMSLIERGPVDTVLALALVHHLAISNNVPLPKLAEFFRKLCRSLIVEFVPKSDVRVRQLLATREDVFPNYTQEQFERAFAREFEIEATARVKESERMLYLMRVRHAER